MLEISLFLSFFKIGLFSVGGGLATLPFLFEFAKSGKWISVLDISNMIAVSESTPGPLGVNMATYVGFLQSGIFGAAAATAGLVAPSVIVIIIISVFLKKFKGNKTVESVFYGLRAASCALIASAGAGVARLAFFGKEISDFFWQGAFLAAALFIMTRKFKWHPIIFIAICAVVGIVFKFDF